MGTIRAAWCALACSLAWAQPRTPVISHVNIVSLDGKTQKVVFSSARLFEAPNWSPDGRYLLLNSEGKLWRLPVSGGEPEAVNTGEVKGINNDHGISRDGKWYAISAGQIYVLPAGGGVPRQVTEKTPSYFHGWSPDGRMLAYCARREDNFDLYAVPAEGGAEKRLTTSPGYDDGPDYSPDGRWIYFNSDRSGSWDIWRIPAEGAGPNDARAERITSDELEDWFPHPSPDGKWLVFVSFAKGTKGHPANQNVVLRMMPMAGGEIRDVARLFGGQGTLNVNSWSPDSQYFAYVSYSLAAARWEPWRFLIGDWVGDGGGAPGEASGGFSYRIELEGRVLVRKNHAGYPATKDRPAFLHEDLMIQYEEPGQPGMRAVYFDNEGHTIHYTASVSQDGATYLSDVTPGAPRYRLTYARAGAGALKIRFEIAPPGKPDAFSTYVEATARRR